MANEALKRTESFLAEGTVVQFRAVKPGTNSDQVVAVAAATDRAIGILQNDPVAGAEASVELMQGAGETKWEAAGAITKNDTVGVSANGRCETKSTAGDFVFGRAMDAAGGAGELIRVALTDTILHA